MAAHVGYEKVFLDVEIKGEVKHMSRRAQTYLSLDVGDSLRCYTNLDCYQDSTVRTKIKLKRKLQTSN